MYINMNTMMYDHVKNIRIILIGCPQACYRVMNTPLYMWNDQKTIRVYEGIILRVCDHSA